MHNFFELFSFYIHKSSALLDECTGRQAHELIASLTLVCHKPAILKDIRMIRESPISSLLKDFNLLCVVLHYKVIINILLNKVHSLGDLFLKRTGLNDVV